MNVLDTGQILVLVFCHGKTYFPYTTTTMFPVNTAKGTYLLSQYIMSSNVPKCYLNDNGHIMINYCIKHSKTCLQKIYHWCYPLFSHRYTAHIITALSDAMGEAEGDGYAKTPLLSCNNKLSAYWFSRGCDSILAYPCRIDRNTLRQPSQCS